MDKIDVIKKSLLEKEITLVKLVISNELEKFKSKGVQSGIIIDSANEAVEDFEDKENELDRLKMIKQEKAADEGGGQDTTISDDLIIDERNNANYLNTDKGSL